MQAELPPAHSPGQVEHVEQVEQVEQVELTATSPLHTSQQPLPTASTKNNI